MGSLLEQVEIVLGATLCSCWAPGVSDAPYVWGIRGMDRTPRVFIECVQCGCEFSIPLEHTMTTVRVTGQGQRSERVSSKMRLTRLNMIVQSSLEEPQVSEHPYDQDPPDPPEVAPRPAEPYDEDIPF
jgi:hypothetical protein